MFENILTKETSQTAGNSQGIPPRRTCSSASASHGQAEKHRGRSIQDVQVVGRRGGKKEKVRREGEERGEERRGEKRRGEERSGDPYLSAMQTMDLICKLVKFS